MNGNIFIIISIIESIYLYFIFNHFKTTYSIHHPFEFLVAKHSFLKHPISTGLYESKICPFGNLVGKLAPIWFIGRYFIKNTKLRNKINTILISLLVICSFLMNMNAFIYVIPIIIFEMILKYYTK